jgi:hypothetical protein
MTPVQVTETLTAPGSAGDQTLLTVNVVSFRVLVIVQEPVAVPLQVPAGLPLPVYPLGTVSVAVHVGVPEKPETVQVFGEPVETSWAPGLTVPPPVQVTVTLTELVLGASDQTLFTVKVAPFKVLVIVQEPGAVPLHVPAGLPLPV